MKTSTRVILTASILALVVAGGIHADNLTKKNQKENLTPATVLAEAAPTSSLSGFSCAVTSLPVGSITSAKTATLSSLQSLGSLTVTTPDHSNKDAFTNGLGSLVPSGQTSSQYFAISTENINVTQPSTLQANTNASGGGSCFASILSNSQQSIKKITLTPIEENIAAPQNGDNLSKSKLTSFKASIAGVDADRYVMYWQVDNDQLNLMNNSADNTSKITTRGIDLSGWFWRGSGPYNVKFIAKDRAGKTFAQSAVTIWVTP